MNFIAGINFATFAPRGALSTDEADQSLDAMLRALHPGAVILTPAGVQQHAQSEQIDFSGRHTMGDAELVKTIRALRSRGVDVILKPTVNCLNGTWRAHINFFDFDVPCEPKWRNWFAAYTEFQLHYARIAAAEGCAMFIPGCEMVMSERREDEWRALIAAIRAVYPGIMAYNCDKYQEDRVRWWDCVDIIASSGYYPLGDWDAQLDRIERVVQRFGKPFFFAELGCMATAGSSQRPNDWSVRGEYAPDEQAAWYRDMFDRCLARDWVQGFAFWDWAAAPAQPQHTGYHLQGTQAADIVRDVYDRLAR